jgi:aminopeptidase 2
MLSTFLGEEVFLSGVKRYLMRHKFSNASTDDLWKALAEESGNDVSKFMTLWTKMTGVSINEMIEYIIFQY